MHKKKLSRYLYFYILRYFVLIYQWIDSYIILIFKKKNTPKVFCIGLAKTGTTSLHNALKILGYRSIHWPKATIKPGELPISYFIKSRFDAFSDFPLYDKNYYKELDKEFPNSKFILTLREFPSLIISWDNYFKGSPSGIHTQDKIEKIKKRYFTQKKEVLQYFKDKPSQLLVMDLFKGDGWEKICKFLKKSIPNVSFPHKRKGK